MVPEPLVWAVVVDVVAAFAAVHMKAQGLWESAAVEDAMAASVEVRTMAPGPMVLVQVLHQNPQCHCPRAAVEMAAMAACNGIHPHANPCPDARHPHRPRRRQLTPPEARKSAARRWKAYRKQLRN